MGRISTGIGLVSGINSKEIIDQLMALEARPKNQLQKRIEGVNQQRLAYTDLSTRLASLKLTGQALKKPSFFQSAATTSSNEDVLTATATAGAAVGAFQFQVARLVTSQQTVSRGFVDFDSDRIGAGTICIELGGGELTQPNPLSQLNGGAGVRRGQFKITDRSGAAAIIDTTSAVTLEDVIRKINTSLAISVKASINQDRLILTDLTGQTASDLKVEDIGDGHAAEDLGIVGNSAGTNTLQGSDINFLGRLTALSALNDGRGVRRASSGNDFRVDLSDGSSFEVSVAGLKTVGDLIDAIHAAGASKIRAEVGAGSNGVRLIDLSSGAGSFAVTALNNSRAARDLGIDTSASGVIDGRPLLPGLGTVLVSSLNGGEGFNLGTISVKSRAAAAPTSIDLSAATSVQEILDLINSAAAGVRASLNAAGNGLQLIDTSGGSGELIIADVTGTTASDFGIGGTFDINTTIVRGSNLQRQWISENTLLSDYNGGKGVAKGKFKITDSSGASAIVDLTQGNETRLADVIAEINSRGIGVVASINPRGDGLLLTDTAAGSLKLTVQEAGSTTAADLGILGEAASGTIDGTFERTIEVTESDTLATIEKKINDLNFGVTASVINDGSNTSPFRLSLTARNSGRAGRVIFDPGSTSLQTRNLLEAQDAAVFLGASGSEQPLLITSSRNQLAGIVKGVNIELHGVSDQPVILNVSRSIDNVISEVRKFADGFNEIVDRLKELTRFDTATNTRGLLLGEATAQVVQTELYSILTTVNPTSGRFRILADIGIRLGDAAKLEVDEDKFRQAYGTDSDSVQRLFSSLETGIGYVMEQRITKLVDPVNGVLTRQSKVLDQRTVQMQDRIKSLDKLLETKRLRLEKQFSQLESVLANLQAQQQAIGQIQTIRPITSSRDR